MEAAVITAVGIDVSKSKSTVAVRRPGGEIVLRPFEVHHTNSDLKKLASTLKKLGGDIRIVMEHTSTYWRPIALTLKEAGFFVSVVNAMLIHDFSDNTIRKLKTDRADALKIANYALTFLDTLPPFNSEEETRLLLKMQSRANERITATATALRNGLIALADQTFPGVNIAFDPNTKNANGHEKWVDFFLRYWHKDCVCQYSMEAFTESYRGWCKRKNYKFRTDTAHKIYLLAQEGVATLPKCESTKMLITQACKSLNAVCEAKQSTQLEMQRLAAMLPEYEVVMQMEGAGLVTGPALMAEIGDVRRFKNKKALVAFAGIDAPPFQSGAFESKSRHVSKRGSPHLRRTIFIRQTAQSRGRELSDEWYTLRIVLDKIDQAVSKTEKDLQDICQSGKEVPRSVLDVVFEDFFASVDGKSQSAQKIDACLTTLGYPDRSLVQRYLQSRAGKTVGLPAVSVDGREWEKAKMLLELQDINKLSPGTLRRYVKMLESDHFSTGKEYYAKSLITRDFDDNVSLLTKSFALGYEPAGEQLLRMYQAGQNIDLSTLVYALLPEACALMAQKQLYSSSDYANLSKKGFTYYKLAAAKGHLPSIQFIVDKLYASDFSHAQSTGPHTARAENGRILCGLCRYLLDHVYQVKHNSEILGVVLFCMGRSYSEAISLLAGIDTPVSNFCKGYMYHHGKGVASDLSMALKYYEQARVEGYQSQRFTRQLEECRSTKMQKEAQAKKSTTYKEEEHYSSHTTYHSSSSDSLCFITTAACRALHADDDCRELNLLRWFRDAKLQSTPQGEAVVREYYRIGPLLVDAIDHSTDPDRLYQSLWENYIGPSCAAIEGQQWDTARHIYIDMVKKLCHQFGVEVRPQILDILKTY